MIIFIFILVAIIGLILGYIFSSAATKAKLAAVEATLKTYETSVIAEVKTLISDVRAHL